MNQMSLTMVSQTKEVIQRKIFVLLPCKVLLDMSNTKKT